MNLPWKLAPDGMSVTDAAGTVLEANELASHVRAHVVAAVNALHAAGVAPEALAADPECVKKLADEARWVVGAICANTDLGTVALVSAERLRDALDAVGLPQP